MRNLKPSPLLGQHISSQPSFISERIPVGIITVSLGPRQISKGRKKHSVAEVTNESAQQPLEKASGEENKTSTKKSSRSKRRERNRQKNAQMAENSVEIAGKILDKAEEPELEKTEAFSEKSESAMAAETVNPVTSLEEIQAQIMAILEERSDDDGWMFLGDIGNMLIKSFPDFDARNYGYKKVRELIEDIPDFEVRSELSSNKRTKLVYVKSRDRNTNL